MKGVFWGLLLCCSFLTAFGQKQKKQLKEVDYKKLEILEDSLRVYAYGVVNDTFEERRFAACKELIIGLKNALKTPHSFEYPFNKIESVSIQYPADSTFRIFTWQLYVNKDDYRYFGAIQLNTPDLKLIPLIDRSFQVADLDQEVLTPQKWYGALYYNIHEVKVKNQEPYYLLFGFDGYQFFRKRKIIEVLYFEEGEAKFGKPVFLKQERNGFERSFNRLAIQYSSEASTRMNYDEFLEMIVFDYMIQRPGPHGEGAVNYPDGSYEGYKLEGGKWRHVPKVFDQVSEDAPRPFPILNKTRKDRPDLFGKTKKKN